MESAAWGDGVDPGDDALGVCIICRRYIWASEVDSGEAFFKFNDLFPPYHKKCRVALMKGAIQRPKSDPEDVLRNEHLNDISNFEWGQISTELEKWLDESYEYGARNFEKEKIYRYITLEDAINFLILEGMLIKEPVQKDDQNPAA